MIDPPKGIGRRISLPIQRTPSSRRSRTFPLGNDTHAGSCVLEDGSNPRGRFQMKNMPPISGKAFHELYVCALRTGFSCKTPLAHSQKHGLLIGLKLLLKQYFRGIALIGTLLTQTKKKMMRQRRKTFTMMRQTHQMKIQ